MQNSTNLPVLEATLKETSTLSESVLSQQMVELLDEQPYLIGALFQMEAQFSEDESHALFLTALTTIKAFQRIGLSIDIIGLDHLEKTHLEIQTNAIEALKEGEITTDKVLDAASSPQTLKTILKALPKGDWQENTPQYLQVILLMDWIITCVEQAIVSPDNQQTNGN
jgi:hypothetical protein